MTAQDLSRVVPPSCIALLTARLVWHDPATGDFLIHGVLNRIHPRVYPFPMPSLGVFCEFTDGRGQTPIALRITREGEEEPLAVSNHLLQFASPLEVVALMVVFHNLVFPGPGTYVLQARCGGNTLLQRRLHLQPLPPA